MSIFSDIRYWMNRLRKPKRLEPDSDKPVTLEPGQTAALEIPRELTVILERARMEGKEVTCQVVANVQNDDSFESLIAIAVDGKPVATMTMQGKGHAPELSLRRVTK